MASLSHPSPFVSYGFYPTDAGALQAHQGRSDNASTPRRSRPLDALPSICLACPRASTCFLLLFTRFYSREFAHHRSHTYIPRCRRRGPCPRRLHRRANSRLEKGICTFFYRFHSISSCLTVDLRPRQVTDAVHAKGSYIFLQLWAPGRATDAGLLEKQDSPSPYVSTSSVVMTGQSKSPHPLTEEEVKYYIAAYAKAASNAVHSAGFDGVEIHSGYGHLLDQFLQTEFNKPSDRRGGDEEARTRFVREVVDAVVDAVGEDRVGIRISPWNTFQGDILALFIFFTCSSCAFVFIFSRHEDARSTTNLCISRHRSA